MITADNELRQEWNRTVDQVLIAGGSHEEVTEFKTEEITSKISESIQKNGNDPSLFSQIIRFAIAVLKEFLDILMRKNPAEIQKAEEADAGRDTVSEKQQRSLQDVLDTTPRDIFHWKERKARRQNRRHRTAD